MRVGLVQAVEGPKRKDSPLWNKREFSQQTASELLITSPSWVSSLPTYPADSGLAGIHRYMNQLPKTNLKYKINLHQSLSVPIDLDTDRDVGIDIEGENGFS